MNRGVLWFLLFISRECTNIQSICIRVNRTTNHTLSSTSSYYLYTFMMKKHVVITVYMTFANVWGWRDFKNRHLSIITHLQTHHWINAAPSKCIWYNYYYEGMIKYTFALCAAWQKPLKLRVMLFAHRLPERFRNRMYCYLSRNSTKARLCARDINNITGWWQRRCVPRLLRTEIATNVHVSIYQTTAALATQCEKVLIKIIS